MNERWEMLLVGLLMIILTGLSLLCGYKVRGVVDTAQTCAEKIVIIHAK